MKENEKLKRMLSSKENQHYPHLEREFILLPAPDQQAWIIATQAEEILSVHGYQTAGMDWGGVGGGEIFLCRLIADQLDFFVEKPPLPDTRGFLLLRVH